LRLQCNGVHSVAPPGICFPSTTIPSGGVIRGPLIAAGAWMRSVSWITASRNSSFFRSAIANSPGRVFPCTVAMLSYRRRRKFASRARKKKAWARAQAMVSLALSRGNRFRVVIHDVDVVKRLWLLGIEVIEEILHHVMRIIRLGLPNNPSAQRHNLISQTVMSNSQKSSRPPASPPTLQTLLSYRASAAS
ncbi:hypothetical protein CI238_10816, partial [Colletotrichum incanum]